MVVQAERGSAADRLQQLLPAVAWGTLEVLVMEPRQLAQELGAGEDPPIQQPSPPSTLGIPAASLLSLKCEIVINVRSTLTKVLRHFRTLL